jgi:putative heme-binding domain-containing protein
VRPELGSPDFDRALEHALIYALIERAEPSSLIESLKSPNAHAQRAALIALDQMPGGNLMPEQVTPLLASTNALLKQTANWIVSHHPEWAMELDKYLTRQLAELPPSATERAELEHMATRALQASPENMFVLDPLLKSYAQDEAVVLVLRAMAQTKLKELPNMWTLLLATVLTERQGQVLKQAVITSRAVASPRAVRLTPGFLIRLSQIAQNPSLPDEMRLDAIVALSKAAQPLDAQSLDFVLRALDVSKTVSERSSATESLTRAELNQEQYGRLADALKTAGPLELPKLLPAFARASDEALGLRVVDCLKEARSIHSLRAEQVRPCLTNFPVTVRARADELLASLNTDAAKEKARLDDLLPRLKDGDVRRGQAIFNSQKAACSSCHAIGYLGGNIGPDLTRIGQIRNERDLLEAIVYPSASFVRSYEPVVVTTKSGDEQSGVLRRDAPDEIVLGTGPGVESRIARADITEMRPGSVSVMPAGLDEQITRQELADLLAFLKATK